MSPFVLCDRFLVGHPARARSRQVGAPSLALAAVSGASVVAVWLATGHLRPDVGPEACVDQLLATFATDEEMASAAEALGDDDRVASLYTETHLETYRRARRIFHDQTELIDLMRPEAVPARAMILPEDGITPDALGDQLRTELPTALQVRSYNPCTRFRPPT